MLEREVEDCQDLALDTLEQLHHRWKPSHQTCRTRAVIEPRPRHDRLVQRSCARSPPPSIWAVLGTRANTLLMKCIRHLIHAAPTKTSAIACFRPGWASLVTSLTPRTPRATRSCRNARQNATSSLGPTSIPSTSR